MVTTTLSPEEIAKRGWEIYTQRIKAKVEPKHYGESLVLDIDSGDYEVDTSEDAACDRIEARHPDGVFYIMRVGYPASLFVGGAVCLW